jgi:hypothetical protein
MRINLDLLRSTERYHYDEPTCGVLIDIFQNGNHWHAVAVAEKAEWYCHNGFGATKDEAIKEAITGVLNLVTEL